MAKSGISKIAPIGKVFGKLTVVSGSQPMPNTGSSSVDCRCECGDIRAYYIGNLLKFRGEPQCPSCREKSRPSRGGYKHPLYNIWKGMIQRCENPKHTHYASYGGRGIKICDAWRSDFFAFARDMGDRPSKKHTIDRVDVDGGYSPENCRWALPFTQGNNRRAEYHHLVDWRGQSLTISEASTIAGISKELFGWRLKRGWPMEKIMTTPPRRRVK